MIGVAVAMLAGAGPARPDALFEAMQSAAG